MPNNNTTSPQRTRRRGQRMTAAERERAQEVFLQSFALTANVRAACLKAGIDRSQVYRWQEHDETFSFQFKQASEDANDMIRAELFRRAVQGYEKPVVSMGKVVFNADGKPMMEKVYSDSLLSLLAKARMPEFREKQHVDVTTQTKTQDAQDLHDAIAKALAPFPDAKIAVAEALIEKGNKE